MKIMSPLIEVGLMQGRQSVLKTGGRWSNAVDHISQ